VSEHLVYLLLYFQGEPFLHPGFCEMVRYAVDQNIYTATSSNAHYFDKNTAKKVVDSGLDRLIISVDGTTQESYAKYRIGGDLEKVRKGIYNLLEEKKRQKSRKPYMMLQFLVFKFNESEMGEMERWGKEIGIKVNFKTAQIYDHKNNGDLIPDSPMLSRYVLDKEGKYEINNRFYNHCWKMWHSSVITWDGRMVPCCFDKDAEHKMGNVNDEDFKSVWHGIKYNDFRKRLLKNRNDIEICRNCSEGSKIWI
jgi:radical SAM protein with 4Fe4S-binding SPASM domain